MLYTSVIVNNQKHFQTNSVIHSVNTKKKLQRHISAASPKFFLQKFVYYAGINIFTNLPSTLKSLMNEKTHFKVGLKVCLNTHSFYSIDECQLSKNGSSAQRSV
jgi:hypothetical protein